MSAPTTGRIDGIDLLRGIAIALVMLRHAWPSAFPGAGVVGVVMFFALSGSLITGLLVDELERTGRVDLRRFYARRARRLVPALLFLVAGVVVVTLLLDPLGDRGELGTTVLVALTWTANLPFGHASDATFHLWTLATEEQFYLVWPAVLVVAFARGRVRLALVVVAAACVLACVATLVWLSEAPDLAYALPTSWAVCFVIGGATRILGARAADPSSGSARTGVARYDGLARRAAPAALVGLAVLSVVPLRGHALTYLAGGPAIAVLTAVLLLSWRSWTTVTGPARALVVLGTVSYGAYLWNYPLTLWLRPSLEQYAGPVAAVLTLVMAVISWRLVERPAQRWRRTREAVVA
ncbi:Peptidoglycan/LPS O-acetylase OafA/YrhL, contains acyltransferase and SGNH-hydrolase domains [Nocardioides exalbidus]|uniref:Peptidoglycan/LPS O-acetylase OafA/YrhL, contains acyltransferase and SGNH-hydrolase domains n=1 Tax=Nocardioides exalbidus TaxID=402596 RepID=A0A1H4MD87_9ACTN|nr:acyltransferase [Nocardioides exalbidus]SEB80986.1 Peptidoglycan/LPS O-acetylase OafA/YrhL, contains acyltransferase and SGNH-hydrolase domains [Nocardioides exalbidus]